MKRKYYGWIYRQQAIGENDSIHVSSGQRRLFCGHSAAGAEAAVDFFEKATFRIGTTDGFEGLNLGRVQLESTPLGLRVFTEEKE